MKKLKEGDFEWLNAASGKTVKIISALLAHLSATHNYKVIFMRRNIQEILRSQKTMLVKENKPTDKVADEELARLYEQHLEKTAKWLEDQPNFQVIYMNYADLLENSSNHVLRLNTFLGNTLNLQKMSEVIDQRLYRQRQNNA